jgi:hypothetical protein
MASGPAAEWLPDRLVPSGALPMTMKQTNWRMNWRTAQSIHEHLTGAGLLGSLPALPTGLWTDLSRTSQRLEQTLARGWHVASQSVLTELDYLVQRMERELQSFRQQLPKELSSGLTASPREIAADLVALQQEFPGATLDLDERKLSITTEPIELEGTHLGPFRIVLRWNQIRQYRAYDVEATEPCAAEGDEEVTHPHVRDGQLCEGEGTAPIKAALSQGRLLDFFTLVRQILETYNPGSAHVSLDRWDGVNCRECGWRMPSDEHGICERCDAALCSDCSTSCQGCDRYVCSGCTSECAACGDYFCASCLTLSDGSNQLLCQTCLENQQEDEAHETDEPSADDSAAEPVEAEAGAALAADTVCLGEAAVPA